jgi:2-keto-4-pentenoate hydratase
VSTTTIQALAERLHRAWEERRPIEPFSVTGELASVEEAYAVQRAWAAIRAEQGETSAGRKIGLTSPGMQRQMGVGEPDFGELWASRAFPMDDGAAVVAADLFLRPRVEGELAFLLGADITGPGVTEDDVLAAALAAAPAIEVVDSRIADWRIALVDTVADNASYGAFTLGEWSEELLRADLRELPLEVAHNGATVVAEQGRAVLGSPLTAVAWLANKLGSFGEPLRAGDVILSGSFGPAAAAVLGDAFVVTVPGQAPVRLRFG